MTNTITTQIQTLISEYHNLVEESNQFFEDIDVEGTEANALSPLHKKALRKGFEGQFDDILGDVTKLTGVQDPFFGTTAKELLTIASALDSTGNQPNFNSNDVRDYSDEEMIALFDGLTLDESIQEFVYRQMMASPLNIHRWGAEIVAKEFGCSYNQANPLSMHSKKLCNQMLFLSKNPNCSNQRKYVMTQPIAPVVKILISGLEIGLGMLHDDDHNQEEVMENLVKILTALAKLLEVDAETIMRVDSQQMLNAASFKDLQKELGQ